jgi:predicted RNase H-like HicB family nuclease
MKKLSVIFKVSLPMAIKKEGKYFISCCPPLDVWSQGETQIIAEDNLKEALQIFLIDCFERGTLDRVLKDCGFIAIKKPLSKKQTSSRGKEINVHLPFIIDQQAAQCHE